MFCRLIHEESSPWITGKQWLGIRGGASKSCKFQALGTVSRLPEVIYRGYTSRTVFLKLFRLAAH